MVLVRFRRHGRRKPLRLLPCAATILRASLLVLVLSLLAHRRAAEGFRVPGGLEGIPKKNRSRNRRRDMIVSTVPQLASLVLLDRGNSNSRALALPFFDQPEDRRQKELCLVNLMRLQSWALGLSRKLGEAPGDETPEGWEDKKKSLYLEARLGSKVVVAESKRISGGATANVFMLKGLHVRECLDDLVYYVGKGAKRKQMDTYREDLIEALASIVEFDGLETTQDDSPRSSLTLSMYNAQKSLFVQRMLAERIVPLVDDILRLFDPDTRAQSEYYMREYYPSEAIARKPP
ncbi:unnamed protein product [Pseudo-nitzschia multistriata]|uniref:Uncharacterized protein n=1 Tax=Pseudo-nitzschia multistriata TaxID=183589 RepID=A0A448YXT2_9STRA|nr:unnamed protein product [Pseudo-nitzschia multistriata]